MRVCGTVGGEGESNGKWEDMGECIPRHDLYLVRLGWCGGVNVYIYIYIRHIHGVFEIPYRVVWSLQFVPLNM